MSSMAADGGHRDIGCDWEGRWNHVKKFLERPGPFTHPDFEPSTEVKLKHLYYLLVLMQLNHVNDWLWLCTVPK